MGESRASRAREGRARTSGSTGSLRIAATRARASSIRRPLVILPLALPLALGFASRSRGAILVAAWADKSRE